MSPQRLFAASFLSICVWIGSASQQVAQAAEPPTIIFGSNAAYPPITYMESGYPKGVVVDVVRAVEKRLGKAIDIRLMAWAEVQKQAQDETIGLLGPIAITEDRKKLYDFSAPILDLSVHLFIRSGRLGLRTLDDIRGLKVGVAAGGLAHQVAKTAQNIRLVILDDDQTKNFKLLADGELDAIIADSWNGGYVLAEYKLADVQMVGDPLLTIPSHLAVKKGNIALLAEVNNALRAIEADGELARIKVKWQPKEVVVATRESLLRQRYTTIVGSLLLVLIAGGLWIIFMRREINRRRKAEASAVTSEERFRVFFDNAMVGMALTSPDKAWVMVNPALCELLGLPAEVLVTRTWAQLTHPDDLAADVAQFDRVITREINGYELEKRFIRGDGQVVHAYMAARAIRREDRSVSFFSVIVMDISARKQLEIELHDELARSRELNVKLEQVHNQLLQSEKMSAIGQLAAGVAHELNNPISFVHSNLGALEGYVNNLLDVIEHLQRCTNGCGDSARAAQLRRICEDKDISYITTDIRQLITESKDGADRVRRIVKNLKDFSHVSESEWHWADLHHGIDTTLTLVWHEIKYKAEVHKAYGNLPKVHCLASELNQVIMNLLVNAAHAIDNKGTITIRTGMLDAETNAGQRVWIEISDTGNGIPPEIQKRIFEPFFTTKPVGKGTGLGLSLAWTIVQKHQGTFEVRSEVGVGTTFRITLPVESAAKSIVA